MTKTVIFCEECKTNLNIVTELWHKVRGHDVHLKYEGDIPKSRSKYDEYIRYIEEQKDMKRKELVIRESSTKLVTLDSLDIGNTGRVVRITCPAGNIITIRGKGESKGESNGKYSEEGRAYILKLYLTDEHGFELDLDTKMRILKTEPSSSIIDLTYPEGITYRYIKDGHKFYKHVALYGQESLDIEVINPNININTGQTRLSLEADFWNV